MRFALLGVAATGLAALAAFTVVRADDASTTTTTDFTAPLEALCRAATLAADGDLRRANDLFVSRAHGPLHDLAATLGSTDRSRTADLLEAKAEVEALLPTGEAGAADALASLMTVAADGAALATDAPAPTCEGITT